MNILLISQYFKPESGAGSTRVSYFAKYLSDNGNKVKVISGIPNYPYGKIYQGYKLKFFHTESFGKNLKVIRTFVFPTKYTSTLKRILNYLSFSISSFLVGIFQRDITIIITSSPPLTAAAVAMILSIFKRKPLIFDVRDIWPGAAVEIGALKNKTIIKLLKFVETLIYRNSRFIVAPTEETRKILLRDNEFLKREVVSTIMNGVDLRFFDKQKIDYSLTKKYNFEGKFVVLYQGTLGLQQGVDTLIDCVKYLKKNKEIVFLVVGEGTDKELVKFEVEKNKLKNLILLDSVEYKKIPSYVNACDVGLALLKKNKYQDAALAVKVFDYFAGNKPVVVSGGTAMRKIIESGNAGFWVRPEDSKLLASKILEISKMPKNLLNSKGQNGRKLVKGKFNKENQVKEWDNIMNSIQKDNNYHEDFN